LTDQPVVWRSRLALPFLRLQGMTARERRHDPVAALSTSALAGADGPIVVLSGEADATTVSLLREVLAEQLAAGARLLTVDASGLSFLDSASIRVLVLAARALRGRHGRLVFARPQPVVARLLEITGADRLLDVRE
jgi:anti-anti-sigma factor